MIISIVGCVAIILLFAIAIAKKKTSVYENEKTQKNLMENKKVVFIESDSDEKNADGVCGHLEAIGEVEYTPKLYERFVKRGVDIFLSLIGLLVLSPIYLGVAIAIKVDDPGPVFFVQKRVGKNKQYFKLHKFRSMKMSTPHDVPTHMLGNPDQYITRVGRFVRKYSIDELPQVWDIFIGNMSIIGPRPALWNQDVLTAERDKWGANDIKPGLTGWAQINGRDELEISEKAKLDGVYCERLKKGGWKAFLFDCRCFLGTVFSAARGEGVVEGGTGEITKNKGIEK